MLILFISILSFISCSIQKENSSNRIILIEKHEDLEKHVGEIITIKGKVSNTKIPCIIGVDILSDSPDLRGEIGIASGVLEKSIVLEEDVDMYSSNRGAGTFYLLRNPTTKQVSQVQSIK